MRGRVVASQGPPLDWHPTLPGVRVWTPGRAVRWYVRGLVQPDSDERHDVRVGLSSGTVVEIVFDQVEGGSDSKVVVAERVGPAFGHDLWTTFRASLTAEENDFAAGTWKYRAYWRSSAQPVSYRKPIHPDRDGIVLAGAGTILTTTVGAPFGQREAVEQSSANRDAVEGEFVVLTAAPPAQNGTTGGDKGDEPPEWEQ